MKTICVNEKIFKKIEDIISDFFLDNSSDMPKIKPDSNLREELRIDELAFIELTIWLENEFELEVSDDDIDCFNVAQDIVDYIQSNV